MMKPMMKRMTGAVALSGALAILAGCVMVPYGTTPKAEPMDPKPVALSERKNVLFERNVDVITDLNMVSKEQVTQYWGGIDERVMRSSVRRCPQIGIFEQRTAEKLRANEIALRIESRFQQNTAGAFFTGLTLMIIPFPCYYSWQLDFTVRDAAGRAVQYHFDDGWREHAGIFALFFVPWYDQSYETVAERVLSNVYDNLFQSMQRDGFFSTLKSTDGASAPGLGNSAAVPKPAPSKAEVGDDRRKELESLRDAGVISEEEYRRELEKMK